MREEEILGKAYDHRLMKRMLRYLIPYRLHVTVCVLLSVVISAMEAVRPLFVKHAVDVNIARGDRNGLILLTLVFLGLILIRAVLQFVSAYLTQWIGQKAIFDLRQQVFENLQDKGLRYFDQNPIGRLVTRVTNDIEVLGEMFSSGIVMVFSDVFTIIGILYFMFTMNWRLALISLSVLPLLFYATFLFRKKVRDAYREVRVQLARINSFMQEHISGMTVDQLFGRERKAFDKFSGINGDHRDANIRSIFYYALFYPAVELIGAIAVALIVWYGGVGVRTSVITLGTIMAFLQFNEMFWRPIRDLSEKYNIMQTAMASSERIFNVLDDCTIVADPIQPVQVVSSGSIEFRNVWFAYEGEEWVLKDVSFTVPPGKTVAIVGHTGAGKSTIINLLCRFYEFHRGEILMDGKDIRHMTKHELRRMLAIVLQDVFLFSGDIRTNVTLGDQALEGDRLSTAIAAVGANRFIEQMPGGLGYDVKERGAGLSVGQRQLISFARALATDPAVLILDEATSSVDSEAETMIQSAIRSLLSGRTAIVIAHRLSTIQRADNILVLHKGELRESGTHDELLARGGIYSRLYRLQYKNQVSSRAGS